MWIILLLIIHYVVSKTIHYECKTNENCIDRIPNSICFNNKCICHNGIFRCVYELRYRRQINFGVRMLGEECESNDECRRTPVDGTKICSLNRCQCSSGHVPIDAYRCIRDFEKLSSNTRIEKSLYEIDESPGYGSICSINKDCQHSTSQLECIRGMCACLEGYVPLGKYLCYNIRGQDAPIIESSTLSTTISTFDPPNNEMIRSLGKLGSICTNDYYCRRSVPQSHCYNGKCSCINGYTSLDLYTCVEDTNKNLTTTTTTTISSNYKSLLGGKCLTNQNCHTLEAICLNNICTCPNNYFPIDDWNCLKDSDESDEELITTTTTTTTTTGFLWWPWSPSTTTRQTLIDLKNTFRFRCLLNRQCISVDNNSHCTLFGRCVCNVGYKLEITTKGQICVRQIINEDNCD